MTATPKILARQRLTNFKWINLYRTVFEKDGKEMDWILVSRRRDDKNGPILEPNAVVIVPILVMPDGEKKLVLIKEYRVPIETHEYHFPAGLMERGESLEEAARRELKEEAGFELLRVVKTSPILPSSAGLTDETSQMVFVECSPGDGKQSLETLEDIEVIPLSMEELKEWAKKPLLYAAKTWPVMLMFEQMGSFDIK